MRETIRNIMSMDKVNKVEIWELFKKCAVSNLYLDMPEVIMHYFYIFYAKCEI